MALLAATTANPLDFPIFNLPIPFPAPAANPSASGGPQATVPPPATIAPSTAQPSSTSEPAKPSSTSEPPASTSAPPPPPTSTSSKPPEPTSSSSTPEPTSSTSSSSSATATTTSTTASSTTSTTATTTSSLGLIWPSGVPTSNTIPTDTSGTSSGITREQIILWSSVGGGALAIVLGIVLAAYCLARQRSRDVSAKGHLLYMESAATGPTTAIVTRVPLRDLADAVASPPPSGAPTPPPPQCTEPMSPPPATAALLRRDSAPAVDSLLPQEMLSPTPADLGGPVVYISPRATEPVMEPYYMAAAPAPVHPAAPPVTMNANAVTRVVGAPELYGLPPPPASEHVDLGDEMSGVAYAPGWTSPNAGQRREPREERRWGTGPLAYVPS
ncbi:hypothetical protein GGF32_005849 [Allomyces javanicus]|nr:hypothetical protein GGF32_005849 [Allomyces javanicus]